jgi:hypothetical protein
MALIHPEHYKHSEAAVSIRGPRHFDVELVHSGVQCGAVRLWGFSCGVTVEGRVCGDHLFPYSMGGPTVATNKMLLCAVHNRMKSSDVHVFPWENGEPVWLSQVLIQVRKTLARNRLRSHLT